MFVKYQVVYLYTIFMHFDLSNLAMKKFHKLSQSTVINVSRLIRGKIFKPRNSACRIYKLTKFLYYCSNGLN